MAILDASEQQFNERVARTPVVQEILQDLNGLKIGQVNLENKMNNLEKKVDDGFNMLGKALNDLKDEIKSDKEKKLIEANESLKAELTRKRTNADTVKNGSLITLVGGIATYIANHFGFINIG